MSAAQTRKLTDDLRDLSNKQPLLAIDQEGGRVQRLGPPHWPAYPPGALFGRLYDTDPALGLNAAGGNIGVSSVQLLTPILMGLGIFNLYQATPVSGVYLQNAGLMWVIPLIVAVFGAVFFMNNLTSAKSSLQQRNTTP